MNIKCIAVAALLLVACGCKPKDDWRERQEAQAKEKAAQYERVVAVVRNARPGVTAISSINDTRCWKDSYGRELAEGWVDYVDEKGGVVRKRFEVGGKNAFLK